MNYFSSENIIHFVGIGGVGMSSIAEILHSIGYSIQGSDQSKSVNVERLQSMGIKVFIGHKGSYVKNSSVVVISSAIKEFVPELIEANRLNIPILKRSDILFSLIKDKRNIVISGSHGKTTTTSLSSLILEMGNLDPTVISGGIINSYGTGARVGQSGLVVVEADESDGTFRYLPALIAVVTNLDIEHLNNYNSMDHLKESFVQFLDRIPPHGIRILPADQKDLLSYAMKKKWKRVITHGLLCESDVRAVNIRRTPNKIGMSFDVIFSNKLFNLLPEISHYRHFLKGVQLSLTGIYNVRNALVALSVAASLGVHPKHIFKALYNFKGVKQRFEIIASINGVTIINDYAHHPSEIRAVLEAIREVAGNKQVIAVIQPHRYSRWRKLYDWFISSLQLANVVCVLPFYSSGEKPISYLNSEQIACDLVNNIAFSSLDPNDLVQRISLILKGDDYIVYIGASDLSLWIRGLIHHLQTKMKPLDINTNE